MDYQEVIKLLKSANRSNDMVGILPKSDISKIIISAMQELKEYHKYGMTPEEVARMQYGYAVKMTDLEDYQRIGTLEEVRDAVEKQRAISREIIEGKYFCPKCHNLMPYPGYCGCGQKLY